MIRKLQYCVMKWSNKALAKQKGVAVTSVEEVEPAGGSAWQKVNLIQSQGSGDERPRMLRSSLVWTFFCRPAFRSLFSMKNLFHEVTSCTVSVNDMLSVEEG